MDTLLPYSKKVLVDCSIIIADIKCFCPALISEDKISGEQADKYFLQLFVAASALTQFDIHIR